MVYIVYRTYLVSETDKVIYGSYYVVYENMLNDKVINVLCDKTHQNFFGTFRFVDKLLKRGIMYHFVNAEIFGIARHITVKLYHVIAGDYMMIRFGGNHDVDFVYTCVLNTIGGFFVDHLAFFNVQNTVVVDNVTVCDLSGYSCSQSKFFVEFISTDSAEIVLTTIEHKSFEVASYTVYVGNFAGTEFAVKFYESFLFRLGRIFFTRIADKLAVVEKLCYVFVRTEFVFFGLSSGQSTKKYRCGNFTRTVYMYPQKPLRIFFEFEPSASRRNICCHIVRLTGLGILLKIEYYTGRTNELTYDYTFRTVNNKRTVRRHEREIAHKHVLFDGVFHFAVFAVNLQSYTDFKRSGKSCVSVFTFFFGVLGFSVEMMIEEMKCNPTREVCNRRKIFENFVYTML